MEDTIKTKNSKFQLCFISRPVVRWKYGVRTKELRHFVEPEGEEDLTTIQLSINGEQECGKDKPCVNQRQ